jgi:hypothetical protein
MLGITCDGLTAPRVAAAQNRTRVDEAIRAAVGGRSKIAGLRVRPLGPPSTTPEAAWLCDGGYGTANVPWGERSPGYVIELPAPVATCVLVWSYDRTGQRQDGWSSVRQLAVETSADGQVWQLAVAHPVRSSDQHGQAVPIACPQSFRWLRFRCLDAGGNPTTAGCDEIELH